MTRISRLWLLAALAAVLSTMWGTPLLAAPPRPPASAPSAAPRLDADAGDTHVVLHWSAVAGADDYLIFRSTNGAFDTTPFARINQGRVYRDWRVTSGTTYAYKVAAVNRLGTGPQSNVVTAMPLAPPAGVVGTPDNGAARLTWRASIGATAYDVFRGRTWSREPMVKIGTVSELQFVDTGLTNGKAYFYHVRAKAGTETSRLSRPVVVIPKAPPAPAPSAAPANLTGTLASGKITLTWSAVPGATGYKLYRTTTNTFPTTPLTTTANLTFVDAAITAGTTYKYTVLAFNATGNGPASAPITVSPAPAPSAAPANLAGTLTSGKITLTWSAVPSVTGYKLYRSTTDTFPTTPLTTTANLTFVDTAITAGTAYKYKVRAYNASGDGPLSDAITVAPAPAPADAPTNLTATYAAGKITLTWTAVPGVTGYRIFRSLNDTFGTTAYGSATTTTFVDSSVSVGTTYFYRVAAYNATGNGPMTPSVSLTPAAPPVAPTGVTAVAGNAMVTVSWSPVAGATAYNVYRGTSANGQGSTPVAPALATTAFVDSPLTNGVTYFYKVSAVSAGGEGPRSAEVNASPIAPPPAADPTTLEAFQLLRQATWGPKPGEVDAVKTMGREAFLAQQFSAPISVYPDALFNQGIEVAQEYFMSLAVSGQDQLRQRVAWALHKIWVVSAVEISSVPGIVTYHRTLLNGAFGNYRDLMLNVTLNPAMGRYLNMVNNKAVAKTGSPANENYARELMQLFTLGLVRLNPNGTPMVDSTGTPLPTYTEEDVKALARIMTGFTYGDGNAATVPGNSGGSQNFSVPMEAVNATANWHDTTGKTFLGQSFPSGVTAMTELNHALDVIFQHPNVGPFVAKQLIQQLVTSNPSPSYVQAVAAVFDNNGSGVRGDLVAVIHAILTHPEATAMNASTGGKLAEPALFIVSTMRALNATVTDHPFMTDHAESMGQKIFFPGSVFSYFAPSFRVRGTDGGGVPLLGPEFQGLTAVTALERANFIGEMLGGFFGSSVTIDYSPFTSKAADPAALVDFCNQTFMGGRMSTTERTEIINAVSVTSAGNTTERARTAIYLTLTAAQAQVDR